MRIMANPQITVVMATYRQAKYLEESLKSLRSQFDDALNPRTILVAVSKDSASGGFHNDIARFAGSFITVPKPNLWNQRQTGLINVDTPYVTFFDSDDVMLPGWLDKGLKVAEEISSRGKIPIVGPSYRMVDEKLNPIQDVILPEFSMDKMMNGCIIPDFSITTTDALRSVGGFFDPDGYDPSSPYYCYSMWLRILKKYGDQVEVRLLPDIGFLYRQHKKAMHHRFAKTKRKSQENVRRQREIARHYFPEVT